MSDENEFSNDTLYLLPMFLNISSSWHREENEIIFTDIVAENDEYEVKVLQSDSALVRVKKENDTYTYTSEEELDDVERKVKNILEKIENEHGQPAEGVYEDIQSDSNLT